MLAVLENRGNLILANLPQMYVKTVQHFKNTGQHVFSRVSWRRAQISEKETFVCYISVTEEIFFSKWLNCRLVNTKKKESRALRSKFHKWRINDCDANNRSFKLSYKVARWFWLLFGSATLRLINCGNFDSIRGCLQQLKWYLNKGSFVFLLFISATEKCVRAGFFVKLKQNMRDILTTNCKWLPYSNSHFTPFCHWRKRGLR